MPKLTHSGKNIFEINNVRSFNELALEIFRYQAKYNAVYRAFIEKLSIRPEKVIRVKEIPFLPVSFFKTHFVITGNFQPEIIFSSSGTTGAATSRHYVKDLQLYQESLLNGFRYFFGNIKEYVVLALLPSYLEREGSSLVYMAEKLIKLSNDKRSGFYLHDYKKLSETLHALRKSEKKVLLLGVTYALLNLSEQFPMHFPDLIVMETGGMKGQRKEMIREELHACLTSAFGVEKIYSEYGMTELLSQAYSKGDGIFSTPPWMKVLIRDINDPMTILSEGDVGGINIIDLANIYSCSFIAVQDLGKIDTAGRFEVIGRFDNSDVRGCNLLVQ